MASSHQRTFSIPVFPQVLVESDLQSTVPALTPSSSYSSCYSIPEPSFEASTSSNIPVFPLPAVYDPAADVDVVGPDELSLLTDPPAVLVREPSRGRRTASYYSISRAFSKERDRSLSLDGSATVVSRDASVDKQVAFQMMDRIAHLESVSLQIGSKLASLGQLGPSAAPQEPDLSAFVHLISVLNSCISRLSSRIVSSLAVDPLSDTRNRTNSVNHLLCSHIQLHLFAPFVPGLPQQQNEGLWSMYNMMLLNSTTKAAQWRSSTFSTYLSGPGKLQESFFRNIVNEFYASLELTNILGYSIAANGDAESALIGDMLLASIKDAYRTLELMRTSYVSADYATFVSQDPSGFGLEKWLLVGTGGDARKETCVVLRPSPVL